MEAGAKFKPCHNHEQGTGAGVLKEVQVADGMLKACSQHRKHENGAEVL